MVWEEAIDGKETIDGCRGEDGDTAGGGGVNMLWMRPGRRPVMATKAAEAKLLSTKAAEAIGMSMKAVEAKLTSTTAATAV
jgi:hypothetical protein